MGRGLVPVRTVRISDALWARLQADIALHNSNATATPINQTGWIIKAIEERLAKRERSRTTTRRKK